MSTLKENIVFDKLESKHYSDYASIAKCFIVTDSDIGTPIVTKEQEEKAFFTPTKRRFSCIIPTAQKAGRASFRERHDFPFVTYGYEETKNRLEAVLIGLADIKLPAIENAIKEAEYITELPPNWDEENAQTISKEVFDSAIGFLKQYAYYLFNTFNTMIEAPEINPVKNGTIDLEWHSNQAQMLINIRKKDDIYYAFFYGDRYNNLMPIKGNVPLNEFSEPLAIWMKYLV